MKRTTHWEWHRFTGTNSPQFPIWEKFRITAILLHISLAQDMGSNPAHWHTEEIFDQHVEHIIQNFEGFILKLIRNGFMTCTILTYPNYIKYKAINDWWRNEDLWENLIHLLDYLKLCGTVWSVILAIPNKKYAICAASLGQIESFFGFLETFRDKTST